MCGRFSLSLSREELEELFGIGFDFESYNICPTQEVPVFVQASPLKVQKMHWGLIPSWAKDPKIGAKCINARVETVSEKPSFRHLLPGQRCVVAADSFYEWDKQKVPHRILFQNKKPLCFAGLWDRWDKGESPKYTFTILTTEAALEITSIHPRMPFILSDEQVKIWLDPKIKDLSSISPSKSLPLEAYSVSSMVNLPKNNSIECHQKVRENLF